MKVFAVLSALVAGAITQVAMAAPSALDVSGATAAIGAQSTSVGNMGQAIFLIGAVVFAVGVIRGLLKT